MKGDMTSIQTVHISLDSAVRPYFSKSGIKCSVCDTTYISKNVH